MIRELNVYVPKIGTNAHATIDAGSGIVGTVVAGGEVRIDFEGNRYRTDNIRTWADKVFHAAGRHTFNEGRGYPTVARAHVPSEDLTCVGTFVYDDAWPSKAFGSNVYRIDLRDDAPAQLDLAAWLGSRTLPLAELEIT